MATEKGGGKILASASLILEICLVQQLQTILPDSMLQIFIGIFIFCLISVIVFNLIQKGLIK